MQVNIQTDDMDARIISALGADGRRSYADVGTEVGLSTAAVHERVKKLLDKGVIRRFSISVDPDRVGLNFTAFVAIRNDGGVHCRDVAPRLRAMPQVEELHSVAGEWRRAVGMPVQASNLGDGPVTGGATGQLPLPPIIQPRSSGRSSNSVFNTTVLVVRATPAMALIS